MAFCSRLILLFVFLLAACSPASSTDDTLPAGDADRGARLFQEAIDGAPACITCHTVDTSPSQVGPVLSGYGAIAGDRVEGQSAEAYTRISIERPAAHIVPGFSNTMFAQYSRYLSDQQLADLIAYLLSL